MKDHPPRAHRRRSPGQRPRAAAQRAQRCALVFQARALSRSVVISAADPVRPLPGRARSSSTRSTSTSASCPTPDGSRAVSGSTCGTIVVGSVVVGSVAMLVAVPFGLGTAIYLAEYARPRVRRIVKPIIEVLAGMPVGRGRPASRSGSSPPNVVAKLFEPDQSLQHARRRARDRDPRDPDHGVGQRGRAARRPWLTA